MSLKRSFHIAICMILMMGEIVIQISSVNILEVIVLHIILFNTGKHSHHFCWWQIKYSINKDNDFNLCSWFRYKKLLNGFKSFVTIMFVSNRKFIAWIVLVPFIKMVINMFKLLSTPTETMPELENDIYTWTEMFPIFAAYIMFNLCFSAGKLMHNPSICLPRYIALMEFSFHFAARNFCFKTYHWNRMR